MMTASSESLLTESAASSADVDPLETYVKKLKESEESEESEGEEEEIDESRSVSDQLIHDKMWYFVPVLTFPHLLMFSYAIQYIICLYFAVWIFFFTSLLFGFFVFYSIFKKRPKWYLWCAISCITACFVYLAMFIEMSLKDYNAMRAANRPAPTVYTALFFSVASGLAVWPFLILGKYAKKTKRRDML